MDYSAFYDAGGTQQDQQGALAVVGLVSTEAKWTKFERAWDKVLEEYDVPAFHMKDYTQSKRAFAKWKGREDVRAQFMDKLIGVLKRGVLKTFSISVMMKDFHEVNFEFKLAERFGYGHPRSGAYALAASLCTARLSQWIAEKDQHGRVAHVYEMGDEGQGAMLELLKREPIKNALGFMIAPKETKGRYVREFEAADLMAWEHGNYYRYFEKHGQAPSRMSLNRLYYMVPCETLHAGADELRAMCAMSPNDIPRRA